MRGFVKNNNNKDENIKIYILKLYLVDSKKKKRSAIIMKSRRVKHSLT